MIWIVALIVVFAVITDALSKLRLKPDLAAAVCSEAQGSRSHVAVRTESRLSGSHGDLPSGGYEYEVFLSFRGSDTREGFIDCLYHALHEDAGVRTFRDDEELRPGEEIGVNLLKTIAESKIYIPIFSQNYASSKWCLKELAFMLERKKEGNHMILPVFYNVTSTEVQDQTGDYGRALRKHEKKFGAKIVQQWREALSEVGHLKGMDLVNLANGYEGHLIKSIVVKVKRELKKAQLNVADNLVGIDDHVDAVTQLLQLGAPEVRIIGLWGMGGIGKTTLSKVIYNHIYADFEGYSFIGDVRETSGRNGLNYLQSSLVANLSRCAQPHFASVDEGIHELKERYRRKKVLILLDDIDDTNQLDALVIRHDSFGPGSRIILTTRKRYVLDRHQVDHIYEVGAMNEDAALKLFCKHAFRKDTPTDEFSGLSNEIVKKTGGLPLALVVIGSSLSLKRKAIWKGTLEKLRIIPKPNKDVHEKFRITFEALDYEQKQIFLDIACFFIGDDMSKIFPMWEDCSFSPRVAISDLVAKSLIKIGDDNEICMHNQLRDFGREIVRQESNEEPGRRSRLWCNDEAQIVLENYMGTKNVEAIRLDNDFWSNPYVISDDQLRVLPNLRYLDLADASVAGDYHGLLSNLRWLGWHFRTKFNVPPGLHGENLVILDLSRSAVDETWNGWGLLQEAKRLAVLDLSSCHHLKRTPDFYSFQSMERLILRNCIILDTIDPSVGHLRKLTSLDVRNCVRLKILPKGLGSLTQLLLEGTSIEEIPIDSGDSTNVETLTVKSYKLLRATLESSGSLVKVRMLVLDNCESLVEIPDNLGGLANLETFSAKSCKLLCRFPKTFGSLLMLRMLLLDNCESLVEIPDNLGCLANLETLSAKSCKSLCRFPKSFGSLVKLRVLLLDNCESLVEIPDNLGGLTNLETISAKSCKSLCRFPKSSGFLVKLQKLLLDDCESLLEIPPSIGKLDSLQELSLSYTSVTDLPNPIEKWSNLEVLDLDHCPIRSFPGSLGRLTKLKELNVSGCLNLRGEIPFPLENLTSLRILRLDHTNISCLPPAISELSKLQTLDLEGCMKLQSLPRLPTSLVNLKVAAASWTAIPNLLELINLKHIQFQHCRSSSGSVSGHLTNEAASSSSSDLTQQRYEYEVFLSFRGPDTRKTFTNILHTILKREGIVTFIDSEELHAGERIDKILEAIDQSKISIPIFSKDYASSKWCLKEAARIVKCMEAGQQVYPIFYDVDPNEVKNQTGDYAEAFRTHVESKKYNDNTIQEWRDALREIASLRGPHLNISAPNWFISMEKSYLGTESEKVVSDILNKLEKLPLLDVTDDLVAIEDHIEEPMRLLDDDVNPVKMLGIWGMAGIGKTTTAKSIFNQLASQFKHRSFLENVRGTSIESRSLLSFLNQLFFDISRRKEEFASSAAAKYAIRTRLKGKEVLILLDDVDTAELLEDLVGEREWLGSGSIIVVTTRKKEVMEASKFHWSNYEVKPMQEQNAWLLFCKHAFQQESPLPRYDDLSRKIVKATGGHPLAIKTVGRYLQFTKEKDVWEEARNILRTEKGFSDMLRICYNALSCEQQQIFLDIACLFKGGNSRLPVHMWKARKYNPACALKVLRSRCLIKIRDGNILWMHDLFIELGQEIVREESKMDVRCQSRLWSGEDAIEVLDGKDGTDKVKAIHLDCGSESEKCCFNHENFGRLSKLEFLRLGDANLDQTSNFSGCLSSLIWLSWHGRNRLDMPSGLRLKKLAIVDLSSSMIKDDWNGWGSIKEAVNIKVINLSGCHQLTKTPNFSTFPHMEILVLEDCQGLVEIGSSIGSLITLKFLDVRNCPSLKKLPKEFSLLVALTEVLLDGSSIEEIPISHGMKSLKIVSAKSCGPLNKVIPPTIGKLELFKELNLSRTGVAYLPESIGNLTNLEVLNIDHCPIRELPQSLWKLRKLEVISASGCSNLEGNFLSELGSLKLLKVMRFDHTSVTKIPESISELPLLRTLDLKDCMKLECLPTLPFSLVELKVTLRSSEAVQTLSNLVNLKELEILYCGELSQVLMDIQKFSKIEKLTLTKWKLQQ